MTGSTSAIEAELAKVDSMRKFDHYVSTKVTFRVIEVLKGTAPSMPIDLIYSEIMEEFAGKKEPPVFPERELKSSPHYYFLTKSEQGQDQVFLGGCSMNGITASAEIRSQIEKLSK